MTTTDDLTKEVELKLSIGHLLVVWEVLANKLADSAVLDTYAEEERRAIWALEDLAEASLGANGIAPRPKEEWDQLIRAAREHVKHIPIDSEDSWPVL
jgi:hypothetical protein